MAAESDKQPPKIDLDHMCLEDHYVHRIKLSLIKTVAGIVETGTLLIAAKKALGHGNLLKVVDEKIGLHKNTVSQYMRIARNPTITNSQNFVNLPASRDALDMLSRIEPDRLAIEIEAGRVHCGITATQAKALPALRGSTLALAVINVIKLARGLEPSEVSEVILDYNGNPKHEELDNDIDLHSELQAAALYLLKVAGHLYDSETEELRRNHMFTHKRTPVVRIPPAVAALMIDDSDIRMRAKERVGSELDLSGWPTYRFLKDRYFKMLDASQYHTSDAEYEAIALDLHYRMVERQLAIEEVKQARHERKKEIPLKVLLAAMHGVEVNIIGERTKKKTPTE